VGVPGARGRELAEHALDLLLAGLRSGRLGDGLVPRVPGSSGVPALGHFPPGTRGMQLHVAVREVDEVRGTLVDQQVGEGLHL
jgi:hypothetical protein